MDKKSISGLLAQLISKNEPKDDAAKAEGAGVETAVNEFLSGEGELHETTRAAVTRGGTPAAPPTPPRGAARPVGVRSVGARNAGSGAASDVAKLLSSKFGLSPAIANLIAPLLVKLVPSIGQAAGTPAGAQSAGSETAAKPKARRKAKPKTVSEASKKAKKKTAAKPKKPAAKPAAKKKTPAKSGKK